MELARPMKVTVELQLVTLFVWPDFIRNGDRSCIRASAEAVAFYQNAQ